MWSKNGRKPWFPLMNEFDQCFNFVVLWRIFYSIPFLTYLDSNPINKIEFDSFKIFYISNKLYKTKHIVNHI